MANDFERFRESYRRVPMVGDPQASFDPRLRQKPPYSDKFDPRLQRSSETNVPTQPFNPNPPHSQPPAGEGPKPQPPRELPPGATPAPPLPPVRRD
jgi:hypothetical protein